MKTIITLLVFVSSSVALAADNLNYSGRLVNTNGSPIAGPRDLEFSLYAGTSVICSLPKNNVALQNGVFNVELDFNGDTDSNCNGNFVTLVGTAVGANESLYIEVRDVEGSITYPKQMIMVPPVALFSKKVALGSITQTNLNGIAANCTSGFLLKTNGTDGFTCEAVPTSAEPSGSAGGDLAGNYPNPTIKDGSVVEDDLAANAVTTAKIANATITAAKLGQMSATSGQQLKWNGSAWAAADETDPTVLGFAKNIPGTCLDSQTLKFDALLNSGAGGLYCESYTTDTLTEGSTNLFFTTARARTAAVADALANGVTNIAPSQNAVFDALALKADVSNTSANNAANTLTLSSEIRFLESPGFGSNSVGLRSPPNVPSDLVFSLPATDGGAGYVLTTNGGGVMSWSQASAASMANDSITSAKIADASIVSADIAADTITAGNIATSAVTTTEILDGTIANIDIANSTITGAKIAGQTITNTHFAGISVNCGSGEILKANGSGSFSCDTVPSGSGANTYLTKWSGALGQTNSIIQDNGTNVGVGTAPGAYKLLVGGTAYINGAATVNGSASASSFLYTSDGRLKKNVKTIQNPLDKVSALRGVNFSWIKDGSKDVGFIAQEVEKVEPRLVETRKDGQKSVKYGNIVAIVVEAVKELKVMVLESKSKNDDLKREMASLKRENDLLKERLDAQDARLKKQEELLSEIAESKKK